MNNKQQCQAKSGKAFNKQVEDSIYRMYLEHGYYYALKHCSDVIAKGYDNNSNKLSIRENNLK